VGGEAGGSPLNAHCHLPLELIAGLPPGQMLAEDTTDNWKQNLHDKVFYRNILLLYFSPPRLQRHPESGD